MPVSEESTPEMTRWRILLYRFLSNCPCFGLGREKRMLYRMTSIYGVLELQQNELSSGRRRQ